MVPDSIVCLVVNRVCPLHAHLCFNVWNYRLGIFGFLGSEELSARTDGYGSGNFGLQDQRAAMAWVQ